MIDEIYVSKSELRNNQFIDCKGPLERPSIYGNTFGEGDG